MIPHPVEGIAGSSYKTFQYRWVSRRSNAGIHPLDHRLVGSSLLVIFQLVAQLEVALPLAVPNRQFECHLSTPKARVAGWEVCGTSRPLV